MITSLKFRRGPTWPMTESDRIECFCWCMHNTMVCATVCFIPFECLVYDFTSRVSHRPDTKLKLWRGVNFFSRPISTRSSTISSISINLPKCLCFGLLV